MRQDAGPDRPLVRSSSALLMPLWLNILWGRIDWAGLLLGLCFGKWKEQLLCFEQKSIALPSKTAWTASDHCQAGKPFPQIASLLWRNVSCCLIKQMQHLDVIQIEFWTICSHKPLMESYGFQFTCISIFDIFSACGADANQFHFFPVELPVNLCHL